MGKLIPDTIRRLAFHREEAWLKEHGEHAYESRNLRTEALEELADAYNYLRHANQPLWANQVRKLGDAMAAFWERGE